MNKKKGDYNSTEENNFPEIIVSIGRFWQYQYCTYLSRTRDIFFQVVNFSIQSLCLTKLIPIYAFSGLKKKHDKSLFSVPSNHAVSLVSDDT